MKLEPRPKHRRDKAAEMLRLEEQRPDSEGFDPRFDLPKGETQRLLAMAARGEQPSNPRERRKLDALVWLTWVDQKYIDMLKRLPHFSEEVSATVSTEEWEAKTSLGDALFEVDVLLQINPEFRARFAGVLNSETIFTRHQQEADDMDRVPDSDMNRLGRVLRMIRLWPEKRKELQDRYYPADQRQQLLEKLDRQTGAWARLTHSAELILLVPELRPIILTKVRQELVDWRTEVTRSQQTETHVTGFEVLQTELASLAILFAENAYIDDQGLVKLELAPLPAGKLVPLPDRPNV